MPGYLGFGGPQVQELAIMRGDDHLELVLSHALLQGFEESLLYERLPILLLEHIESASFSFLGLDEEGELAGWTSTWETPGVLPESIALDIEFTDEVYIQWPMLTASVRIDPSALANLAPDQIIGSEPRDYGGAIQDMINRRRNKQ